MQPKPIHGKLTFLLSFIILLLCTGCPYKSDYPMAGKVLAYDVTFNGSWKNNDAELTISRIDDHNFRFYYNDYDPDFGAGELKGKGYVIDHAPSQFVVLEQATTPKSYFVYKIVSIRPNTVKLNELDEALVRDRKFSSTTAFTKFINDNLSSISAASTETWTRTRR